MTFEDFLLERGIDCLDLDGELRSALLAQFAAEQPVEPPTELLVIPDDCDQWGRALRLPMAVLT